METKLLRMLGKIAGIGGIAIGVMLLLLKDVFVNQVFQSLPADKAYQLLLVFIIGSFVIGVLGIAAWLISIKIQQDRARVKAEKGSVAFGDNAKSNTVTVNNSNSSQKADD